MQTTISLFEAIAQMRELSRIGIPFSFAHATWDEQRRQCSGIRHVHHASLRPAANEKDIQHANHKLFYTDHDELPRVCWQVLIMFFNGKRIIL